MTPQCLRQLLNQRKPHNETHLTFPSSAKTIYDQKKWHIIIGVRISSLENFIWQFHICPQANGQLCKVNSGERETELFLPSTSHATNSHLLLSYGVKG